MRFLGLAEEFRTSKCHGIHMSQVSHTVLTLVRHGETSANIDGVWHGSIDTPLTRRGHEQASRVAAYAAETCADAVALYSSPLQRARDTAGAIGELLNLEVRFDPDLAEYDLGSWEGKTYSELQTKHKLWDRMRNDPDFAPPGGESPRQVATRFSGALRRIASAHPGVRVLVVTHGGAMAMSLGEILDGDLTKWRGVMANCAVSELVLDPQPVLLSYNHTTHLEGA